MTTASIKPPEGTNPLADRWLVRCGRSSIIAEASKAPIYSPINCAAPGSRKPSPRTWSHPRFERSTQRARSDGPIPSRQKPRPQGLPIEYYYGCFARGEQAFQVVAFTRKEDSCACGVLPQKRLIRLSTTARQNQK